MTQQQQQSGTVPPRWGLADKPWKDSTARGPNIGSYGAGTVFGLVSLAWETMVRVGVPSHLIRANIRSLAETFASVVAQSAADAVEFDTWNDGSIQRFSGALRTFLEHGVNIAGALTLESQIQVVQAVSSWARQARAFCAAAAGASLDMTTRPPSFQDTPWRGISWQTPTPNNQKETNE